MPFISGQRVIWAYRPQWRRSRVWLIAAEVVQGNHRRIRIRVRTASGKSLLRWVHPKNLRSQRPNESADCYPEPPDRQ